ncbi:MAG: MipA/OmpV family protein [Paracoccaceae bacterium]|nr:MipA/OmpV family protein [Paracoccaceae bacterium]
MGNGMMKRRLAAGSLAVALAAATAARADGAPPAAQGYKPGTLEYGIFVGGLVYPSYPSAKGHSHKVVPVPYLHYEGRFFSIGGGSIAAAHVVKKPRLKFDVSLAGSFDANSSSVPARAGMPSLHYIFEAGPVVTYRLGQALAATWTAEIPLRAVFQTDLHSLHFLGESFSPGVAAHWAMKGAGNADATVRLHAIFASRGVQDYFYTVAPSYATPSRPAYSARAGYLGSELAITYGRDLSPRVRIFGYARLGFYGGAANHGSPLFGQNVTTTFGLALRTKLGVW